MEKSEDVIDLTNTDDDESTEDNNHDLSDELALVTGEQRIIKKPKIINESVVCQDVIDDMEKLVSEGDMRGMLGIKTGREFEMKWVIECEDGEEKMEWYGAKVVNAETGKTHRFRPDSTSDDGDEDGNEDGDEYVESPVVQVKCMDDDELHDVVFISPHEVFHIEFNFIMAWRDPGDEWDESDDEDNNTDVSFEYSNDGELKELAIRVVSEMFVNTLEKYSKRYEQLSVMAKNNLGCEILRFKEVLTNKIIDYFKTLERDGTRVTIPKEAIGPLFDDALKEMENN